MTDGLTLKAGEGNRITVGGLRVDVKVSATETTLTSTFEVVVPPRFDVGAHRHEGTEELFYVLSGELDLLAFEPISLAGENWTDWRSASGQRVLRAGAGSMIFVPSGCPHAFANPTTTDATMLFQASPSGHEEYFQELSALLADRTPDPRAIVELREKYGIEQITAITTGSSTADSAS
ncbi:MAG TPA: cupin domain-containing protein [Pseudonocardiaceae bacterium]|nr:cupin domain-containing protein [Pseudonocardiaceae bacterium]